MKNNNKYQHEKSSLRLSRKHQRAREAQPFRPAWTESNASSTKSAKEGEVMHKEPLMEVSVVLDSKASLTISKPHLLPKSHSNWKPPLAKRSRPQRPQSPLKSSSSSFNLLLRSPTHRRPNGRNWPRRSSECSRGRSRIWTRSSSCSRSCLGRTRGF